MKYSDVFCILIGIFACLVDNSVTSRERRHVPLRSPHPCGTHPNAIFMSELSSELGININQLNFFRYLNEYPEKKHKWKEAESRFRNCLLVYKSTGYMVHSL